MHRKGFLISIRYTSLCENYFLNSSFKRIKLIKYNKYKYYISDECILFIQFMVLKIKQFYSPNINHKFINYLLY